MLLHLAHWRIRSTTIGTPNKMVNPHRLRLMKAILVMS
ncbi:Uncharacterised protein [Vibrio cholerae]|nr:Uncharacterised protein [Vibrio cholerae]